MDIIMRYIAAQGRRGLSSETLRSKRSKLEMFAAHIAPLDVLDATPAHVQSWADSRSHLAAGTRHNDISTLSTFYKWAQRHYDHHGDPTEIVDRPMLGSGVPRPLDDDDLAHALSCAPPLLKAWLALASLAGMRCCEIARLERDDVLDRHDPPVIVVRFGKGRKQRVVPLNPIVLSALRQTGMPRRGRLWDVTPNQVSKKIASFLRDVGVDGTAHMGRHWFGTTTYKESNGNLRLVQDLMGHSSPEQTARYAAWSRKDAFTVVLGLTVPGVL